MRYAKYWAPVGLLLFSVAADWWYAPQLREASRTFQFDWLFTSRLLLFVVFYLLVFAVLSAWQGGSRPIFYVLLVVVGIFILYGFGVPIKPFGGQWFRSFTPLMEPHLALTAHCGALFAATGLRGLVAHWRA